MYHFLIGRRDDFQENDNLFFLKDSTYVYLDYELPVPQEYNPHSNFINTTLPPELWEKILDSLVVDYLKEFNFGLLCKLLLVSKNYLRKFYSRFFGRDRLVNHRITIVKKYYRISQTLNLLEQIVFKIYLGMTNTLELLIVQGPSCGIMPWDIHEVNCLPQITPLIYDPYKRKEWTPHKFEIGPVSCFIHGKINQSLIEAEYFRLPVIILKVMNINSEDPELTSKFLSHSQSWRSVSRLLAVGFGRNLGIYHYVKTVDLPDNYIFHSQVLFET